MFWRSKPIVYTAITQGYDTLKEQPLSARRGAEFVAFIDKGVASAPGWKIKPILHSDPDPCRSAKRYKILSHQVFPKAPYSLWIDGTVSIRYTSSTSRLIETYLKDADLCVFKHSRRGCVYEEAARCLELKLDPSELIKAQIERYRAEAYPENAGLVEATVLLRRHTPAIAAFNEAWWKEILQNSKRDQISFNYIARKLSLRYNLFPSHILEENGLFSKSKHLREREQFD